ncbi:hypothetical protein [Pseudomonas oryzihabitans]|uniref:Uncharacterized protein n=1 Tax=Pseudomonas oryzihabitans TaxID=47885 RepID=A0AAJ2BP46_9PSED|nr:hypothetical protein [Pseudomonas psychrotolerans]MDR6233662.1 hypothetical protein [Pseudomonas psychrotolerans]MDR6357279.1 hypothetical protein [Pseudomonas psychrotolerans]
MRSLLFATTLASGLLPAVAANADARSVPSIESEDASLGSVDVSEASGRFHPQLGLDVRNGDFSRGNYDDDAANLDRIPLHAQVGFALDLHQAPGGATDAWLVFSSSNGFHTPSHDERVSPRRWYESNNLLGLVVSPMAGLRVGFVYTVKTSPNDVAATTQEASLALAYQADSGLGAWRPGLAVTTRTQGDGGLYTQGSLEPGLDLSPNGLRLSFPSALGVGWNGFYGPDSGDRLYARTGLALEQPFRWGETRWSARAEALALYRDGALRELSGPEGETDSLVPQVTLSLSMAY